MVRFSGTRSSGDIDSLKILFRFFDKLRKHPGQLGLILIHLVVLVIYTIGVII